MSLDPRRISPTLVAGVLGLAYVIISPPSLDLAAHLFRARLFSAEGFGIWNNWWYAGHHVLSYSVLFPPVAAALTPQVAAAIAATGTATAFESLAYRHFGPEAWVGALWFGAATATNLFTGRLTFAFGLLPAVLAALALQRGRPRLAASLSLVTALASPVAALFAALAGASFAIGNFIRWRGWDAVLIGATVVIAALAPVALLAVLFPEGGYEPFAFAALWPIPLIAVIAFIALPREETVLRTGVFLYVIGCLVAFAVKTPVGSNAARLGTLFAGPFAALVWWRRRDGWLLFAVLPLAYLQWQAPVRDISTAAGDPAGTTAYWRPLLSFLDRQTGPPFRVEIPFTQFHWEAYEVAPRFSLARGWERQLDIKYNHLFYGGTLTAATYDAWLHELAVRFVAVSDANLDYSAAQETALIDRGLPYLRLVMRAPHWRIYAVRLPTPIVQGVATLSALGPNSVTLRARHAGRVLVRVRFTPYWAVGQGSGCVAPAGEFTGVTVGRPGTVRLVISFGLDRVGARSARCR